MLPSTNSIINMLKTKLGSDIRVNNIKNNYLTLLL